MNRRAWGISGVLFFFALSFTFFEIQSGDVLMYLAIARDFLLHGHLPLSDPYLYSLPGAELHVAHEYLSHLLFYGAWVLAGFAGLTLVKIALLAMLFAVVLREQPRLNSSVLFILLWVLAVWAGSFRFIERSSTISDLFCVIVVFWLLQEHQITPKLIAKLSVLFFLWVQFHPGYPIGIALLFLWAAWHFFFEPQFQRRRMPWLLVPLVVLLINPLGWSGAIYPFQFSLEAAPVLKLHNLEWFPSYHPAFRWAPETVAFWILLTTTFILLLKEKAWLQLRALFFLAAAASAIMAVRFVPWASFALLIIAKPWCERPRAKPPLVYALVFLLAVVGVKNLSMGYTGSSGPRHPRFGLDANFFPVKSVQFLKEHPIPGQLYNAQDFGSYLIWSGYTPIFHHGFVTDMDFYEHDVIGVFRGQARFLELAKKYGWTKLLVDKHGSYPYFYKILSPLPDWKIVAEDDASYLIYYLPK